MKMNKNLSNISCEIMLIGAISFEILRLGIKPRKGVTKNMHGGSLRKVTSFFRGSKCFIYFIYFNSMAGTEPILLGWTLFYLSMNFHFSQLKVQYLLVSSYMTLFFAVTHAMIQGIKYVSTAVNPRHHL